ncbi:MogA/MoaB family molybdenum cofactor biosynthesis protein [Halorubellus sp. JP-L1]|uniref:MogA/MoaB family molybdenum cofactor biosynthesis protein n=1 Tax=Halorubellus sp. JP-L1 TaxID=2715753 RepID=UPI00140C9922|nr:MogA/MoaB family molybdenum cofactor biosynthesis protein [Halorubellus sp. JP-L1]NHN41446.1 MogA/MoaB family molybdenum cofactor biosynthesis protein [Halorubellus sp. JP-L1]
MTDGDGHDHGQAGGDGEHASERVPDSERGHDHPAGGGGDDERRPVEDGQQAGDDAHHAGDAAVVRAAVVTVSSTRSLDDDPSGDLIADALTDAGHAVVTRELIRDEFDGVQGTVARLVNRRDVDVIVTTGGTGVTDDDVTPEAVDPVLGKRLPGFGEEFRRRSVAEIGAMGIVSRALAGVADGTVVVCLPGSESAVRTGMDLLEPVVGHLVGLAEDGNEDVDASD